MPLWNLLESIPGHSEKSTLSEHTLVKEGYFVPNPTGYKAGQEFQP
jgi:hypothetical protein